MLPPNLLAAAKILLYPPAQGLPALQVLLRPRLPMLAMRMEPLLSRTVVIEPMLSRTLMMLMYATLKAQTTMKIATLIS
jgi:hypothetical protein